MQDLSKLRLELSTHTNVITLFLNLLSVGSLGKVEEQMTAHGEELRAVRRSVNWVTASLQASADHGEGSILTAYTDDDKVFWKDFRRKMVKEGHTSRVVRKYERFIMDYVQELGQRGALDELPPMAGIEDPGRDTNCVVETEVSRSQESPTIHHPAPPQEEKSGVQIDSSASSSPIAVTKIHSWIGYEPLQTKEAVDSALLSGASLPSNVQTPTKDLSQTRLETSESCSHVRPSHLDTAEAPKAPSEAELKGTKLKFDREKENRSSTTTSDLAMQQHRPTSVSTPSNLYRPPYVTDESDVDDEILAQNALQDVVQVEVLEQNTKKESNRRQTSPSMPAQQERSGRELRTEHLESLKEEDRKVDWRRAGYKENSHDREKREEPTPMMQQLESTDQACSGQAIMSPDTSNFPKSKEIPTKDAQFRRSAFIGNPDGSWQRELVPFDTNELQGHPASHHSRSSSPVNPFTEDVVGPDQVFTRVYPAHENLASSFWHPTQAANSLHFVQEHIRKRGQHPLIEREEVIHKGEIFVVPGAEDPFYVSYGLPAFAYSQNGARVAVTGTRRNLVVQERDTVPKACQPPTFNPPTPAKGSTPRHNMSRRYIRRKSITPS